ncbi:MAG: glycosyltransferase family 1 protein [Clostridia bacterium]|nr:glycosyltransferase family 1 protein [Clostridia bacterium]
MRIAYFTDTFHPQINGVTNTLDRLETYLKSSNIQHMFFAPSFPRDIKSKNRRNVRRFRSVSFPLYPECRLSIPLYANISRLADRFRPDLVHLVTPLGIGFAGLRYARERGLPIVMSYHTNFDAYLKYYNLEFIENAIWNFFKWFHSHSSANFCPSKDTMEILKSNGIENVKLWSRGIDTTAFCPSHKDLSLRAGMNPQNKVMFLYVGRLAAEKDLDILVDSIQRVSNAHPGKAQFIIAGDGPYAEEMKKTLSEDVIFTGYLKGQPLSALYASCDAFVFPSTTETFGNVVLEAMASGLPVITVDSGGVKDSVRNGFNGFLCKPRDAESFSEAIVKFLDNQSLIAGMSQNARQYTLAKSWNRIFDQLLLDYKSVLDEVYKRMGDTA